eukprot:5840823-Pyramimonas_sp.AAC.2
MSPSLQMGSSIGACWPLPTCAISSLHVLGLCANSDTVVLGPSNRGAHFRPATPSTTELT